MAATPAAVCGRTNWVLAANGLVFEQRDIYDCAANVHVFVTNICPYHNTKSNPECQAYDNSFPQATKEASPQAPARGAQLSQSSLVDGCSLGSDPDPKTPIAFTHCLWNFKEDFAHPPN